MSYKNNGIQIAQGNLNSAAMNAMRTTAQTLLPAPGAGFVNVVLGSFFNAKIGSVAWNPATDFGNMWLVYGTTGNDQVNVASQFLTNQLASMSANTNYVFGTGGGIGADWLGSTPGNVVKVLSSNAINKAVSMTCVNTIVTAGNGNMDWTLWYSTVKCS